MRLVLAVMLVSFRVAMRQMDGEDEGIISSTANLTQPETKTHQELFDSSLNFITGKIGDAEYVLTLCLVANVTEMQNCQKRNTIIANNTNKEELEEIMKKAKKNFSSNVFLILSNQSIKFEYESYFPKQIFFLQNDSFLNPNNETEYIMRRYYGINCELVRGPMIYYTTAFIIWLLLLPLWLLSLFQFYKHQVLGIHHKILYLSLLQWLSLFFLWIRTIVCTPLDEEIYLIIGHLCAVIFFSAFYPSLLLAISMVLWMRQTQGIPVLSQNFTRCQFNRILLISFFSYVFHSVYYIFSPTRPFILFCSHLSFVLFHTYLLSDCVISCLGNIKRLKTLIRTLDGQEMEEIKESLEKKIAMYFSYASNVGIFCGYQIFMNLFSIIASPSTRTTLTLQGISSVSFLILFASLMVTFHPKFFTASFRLGQINNAQGREHGVSRFMSIRIPPKEAAIKKLRKTNAIIISPSSEPDDTLESTLKRVQIGLLISN